MGMIFFSHSRLPQWDLCWTAYTRNFANFPQRCGKGGEEVGETTASSFHRLPHTAVKRAVYTKIEELETWAKYDKDIREACPLAFRESWLTELDWDEDLTKSGFGKPIRLDQSLETTGKS